METNHILIEKVKDYVEQNIGQFHQNRIQKLETLRLKTILSKKNPYLFKAKYCVTAYDIVKSLTDAFLSSAEEKTIRAKPLFMSVTEPDARIRGIIPPADFAWGQHGSGLLGGV